MDCIHVIGSGDEVMPIPEIRSIIRFLLHLLIGIIHIVCEWAT